MNIIFVLYECFIFFDLPASFFVSNTDSNTVIELLDIPVNAVATALKDFFSKRLPPLFSKDIIKELEEVAGK